MPEEVEEIMDEEEDVNVYVLTKQILNFILRNIVVSTNQIIVSYEKERQRVRLAYRRTFSEDARYHYIDEAISENNWKPILKELTKEINKMDVSKELSINKTPTGKTVLMHIGVHFNA